MEWWRPQPPPLCVVCQPACHGQGRGSSHPSQRDFLHRFTDLDDIDTPGHAAYDSICAAIHALSPGGIYLGHRCGCRAVAAPDDYRAVNHLDRQPRPRCVGDAGLFHFLNVDELVPRRHTAVGIHSPGWDIKSGSLQHCILKPRVTFQRLLPMAIH